MSTTTSRLKPSQIRALAERIDSYMLKIEECLDRIEDSEHPQAQQIVEELRENNVGMWCQARSVVDGVLDDARRRGPSDTTKRKP